MNKNSLNVTLDFLLLISSQILLDITLKSMRYIFDDKVGNCHVKGIDAFSDGAARDA